MLFYLFLLVTISVKLRGLEIQCGCFGPFSFPVSWTHASLCLMGALLSGRLRSSSDCENEGAVSASPDFLNPIVEPESGPIRFDQVSTQIRLTWSNQEGGYDCLPPDHCHRLPR